MNESEAAVNALANKVNAAAGGGNMAAMMPLMMQLFEAKIDNVKLQNEFAMQRKDEEIEALEAALDEKPEEKPLDSMGKIGAIIDMVGQAGNKSPWIQDIVKNFMGGFTNVFNAAKTQYTAYTEPAMRMNGVPPEPTTNSMEDKLKWANNTLIFTYRTKYGVKMNEQGQPIADADGSTTNRDLMNKADAEYVEDMVKVAKVASSKPNTWDTAIKSLREMV